MTRSATLPSTRSTNTAAGVPSFLFSYFVGVDENGHMHGGASPEYAAGHPERRRQPRRDLGRRGGVGDRPPGEGEWTIIVVTDHGHQPQQGFGHGFQSPDETATFVIADGPDFEDGYINPEYEIVDTTPTVVTLFGGTPPADSDGVSLTTLGGSDEDLGPGNLHQALEEVIAKNNVSRHRHQRGAEPAHDLRHDPVLRVHADDRRQRLPSPGPRQVLYVATNIPAQIVARLTGVTGASIFPLLPPGPPSWPGQEATEADTAVLACGGDTSGSAAELCDAGNVV